MAEVVSLRGGPLPTTGKPSEALIEFLERRLEEARSGETIGFAGAFLHSDKSTTFNIAGFTGGYSMVGALECAKTKLLKIAFGE